MLHMNKKGFLLLDSLVCVVIVVSLCTFVLGTYQNIHSYYDGYDKYQREIAESYSEIYDKLYECEKCEIEEEDSSNLET